MTTLQTDIDWLREHTRLPARANEWIDAGRTDNRLLSGNDIVLAKEWVANRPKDSPEPTDLHLTYIKASEAYQAARRDEELQRQAEMARLKAAAVVRVLQNQWRSFKGQEHQRSLVLS